MEFIGPAVVKRLINIFITFVLHFVLFGKILEFDKADDNFSAIFRACVALI